MRRLSRRRLKGLRLAALVALAVAVGFFGKGHWPGGPHPGQGDPFPPEVSGSAKPIDGDSLWVGSHEVRLKGIDAPEGRQTCRRGGATWNCGDAARDALFGMIGKETVSCEVSERDRYGRLLARCRAGGRDLNAGMVAAGMAVAFGGYEREETAAKTARRGTRRGIWEADFQTPRQWRDEHNVRSPG